jgi:hypothetical protein
VTAINVSSVREIILQKASPAFVCKNARSPPWPDNATISAAVIDGPYDVVALAEVLAHKPINLANASCDRGLGTACVHGTFVMGLIGARYDAAIAGLCPDCQLLHFPLFVEERSPSACIDELACGIRLAVEAGARLINLSLAILGDDSQRHPALADALNYAESKDCVLVAAAGNQSQIAAGQLLSHPVTIPVVAVDAVGNLLPQCNFGPLVCQRGVAALGENILGYAPRGRTAVMSGTSVATAVATATLATIWAALPTATGAVMRRAVQQLGPRDGLIPPLMRRDAILAALIQTLMGVSGRSAARRDNSTYTKQQGGALMRESPRLATSFRFAADQDPTSRPFVAPARDSGKCACGAPDGICRCDENASDLSGFVYAIGTVEAAYPNVAIEREMQIMADHFGVELEHDIDVEAKPTENRIWQYKVLSKKETRYLARQMRWRFLIEDFPAFILTPRDPNDLELFIESLNRPKYIQTGRSVGKERRKAKSGYAAPPYGLSQDLDVVVGIRGGQTVDGIEVLVDQIFRIPQERLHPRGQLFLAQLSDNYGLTDGERAYNFLAARYTLPQEYFKETEKDFVLAGAPVIYSRLSGSNGRVVRVIFTLRGTTSAVEKKYFVRVDVTHEFPIIVNPWQPYLERGEAI